jgi:hypothetical protein
VFSMLPKKIHLPTRHNWFLFGFTDYTKYREAYRIGHLKYQNILIAKFYICIFFGTNYL